jgi:epoxide hydrolase-like predicted phosphatase
MRSDPIEAVLFDYGGVFTASPFAAVGAMSEKLGVPGPALLEIIFGPYDRDTDHPWHRLERGELSLGAAREEILALGRDRGSEVDLYEFFGAIASITRGVVEPMVACARRLKVSGYRTAIVTNNVAEFSEHWRMTLPLDELFHSIVDSSQVGMRKPDPRIFAHALQCLGNVAPQRAVFLDDFHGNVTAASSLGMHGILVEEDPTGAIEALERLLADR